MYGPCSSTIGKFTNGYSNIVDWWSLGIITYELITGKTPFCKNNRETPYAIYLRVLKGKIKFPRNLDASAKEIIKVGFSGILVPLSSIFDVLLK
jgi:serine/threonine protein kinase